MKITVASSIVLNEVDKVLVENGAAKGIRLKNGTEIAADIVISDLSVELTLEALGKEYVPPAVWAKAQKLKEKPPRLEDTGYERTQLFWGNIALMEAPKYPMNPDLGMVPRLYFGEADPEYLLSGKYQQERWDLGIANKLYLLVAPDSQWDRTRAPAGRFTALLEEFTCPWRNFRKKSG